MTEFNEEGHTTTKVKIDATTSEKMEDKSTVDHNEDKLHAPMSDTLSKNTNEMKHSTKEDQGYGDLVSAKDLPILKASVNAQTYEPSSNTENGNVGEGAKSPFDYDKQDKTSGSHLAESILSFNVSNSKKRKSLTIQNIETYDFLPKRKEIIEAVNEVAIADDQNDDHPHKE
ncbi:hypothetical protein V6N11_043393 [Hibiscus sabdariffa]|uniref:Uncharacterized protein n=1 Tax=Hibiscus sabdariffa TaxID=183260 RepID=A0ABR2RCN6_9ROSI